MSRSGSAAVTLRRGWRRSVSALALLALACGGEAEPPESGEGEPASAARPARSEVEDAARRIVAFLRGEDELDTGLLSDSVTLYVAPEGGGGRRRASREELMERSAWDVDGRSFLPPRELTELVLVGGRHVNCLEMPLADRFPELADQPHIAAVLRPPGAASCLQTWNITLVFDGDASRPRLAGVVYDQWEW